MFFLSAQNKRAIAVYIGSHQTKECILNPLELYINTCNSKMDQKNNFECLMEKIAKDSSIITFFANNKKTIKS